YRTEKPAGAEVRAFHTCQGDSLGRRLAPGKLPLAILNRGRLRFRVILTETVSSHPGRTSHAKPCSTQFAMPMMVVSTCRMHQRPLSSVFCSKASAACLM